MSHLDASPLHSLPSPSPAAQGSGPHHAQYRAAELLGGMIDFFEAVEGSSPEARRRASTLLEADMEQAGAFGLAPEHDGGLRRTVLRAAVAILRTPSGTGAASGPQSGSARDRSPEGIRRDAGRLQLHARWLLELAAACRRPGPGGRASRAAELLVHMLHGAGPRMWEIERHTFARSIVDVVTAPGPDPQEVRPGVPRSTGSLHGQRSA